MADTKITALTALTAADPANDVIPIVDVSDTTMAASGTTKKISVNNILGASGTATLASATITGDLTVRTNKLAVNATGVGVNTASPAQAVDVASGNLQVRTGGTVFSDTFSNYGAALQINAAGSLPLRLQIGGTTAYEITSANVHTWSNVGGVSGTAMTLNATGLGVGGSPAAKISCAGYSSANQLPDINIARSSSGTAIQTGPNIVFTDGTSNNTVTLQNSQGRFGIWNYGAGAWNERLSVDSSGNVGIGVTPSAWAVSYKSIEVGAIGSFANDPTNVSVGANRFFNGTNSIYKTTAAASVYNQTAGTHAWYTAPSGTAGNAITFTQAMTLDASGNLLVGVASSSNRLDIQKSTDCAVLVKSTGANTNIAMDYVSNYGNHTIRKSGTAVWDFGVINDSSATPAFKFSNGPSAVGVQLVHGATAWTALSDETVKDIIEPITNAITKVGSLRSVIGKFKTDDASKRRSFLIAQDVFAVLPEAVDVVGEKNELGVRYSDVIPLLVAAIKELSAEVNALKNA